MSRDTTSGDNLDIAADLQQQLNESSLERVRRAAAPESHPDFDGKHCLECGEKLPKLRLTMARIYCVLCQTAIEKAKKVGVR